MISLIVLTTNNTHAHKLKGKFKTWRQNFRRKPNQLNIFMNAYGVFVKNQLIRIMIVDHQIEKKTLNKEVTPPLLQTLTDNFISVVVVF